MLCSTCPKLLCVMSWMSCPSVPWWLPGLAIITITMITVYHVLDELSINVMMSSRIIMINRLIIILHYVLDELSINVNQCRDGIQD